MITVLPEGGLCNRMRVVASAQLLAEALGQPMRVLWYRTPDFNARFDAIFDMANLPFAVVEGDAMSRLQRGLFRIREQVARIGGALVLGPKETRPGHFNWEAALRTSPKQDVFVRTNSRLKKAAGMYNLFRPSGEAAEILERLGPQLRRSIGVHIRGTDNEKAKAESTLDRFITLMREAAEDSPDAIFFLATDEPQARDRLLSLFGEKVWEYPKRAYSRNDPTAITDAVVDLYALGWCQRLIGSYWSSFTDTAAELNDIDCTIARSLP